MSSSIGKQAHSFCSKSVHDRTASELSRECTYSDDSKNRKTKKDPSYGLKCRFFGIMKKDFGDCSMLKCISCNTYYACFGISSCLRLLTIPFQAIAVYGPIQIEASTVAISLLGINTVASRTYLFSSALIIFQPWLSNLLHDTGAFRHGIIRTHLYILIFPFPPRYILLNVNCPYPQTSTAPSSDV